MSARAKLVGITSSTDRVKPWIHGNKVMVPRTVQMAASVASQFTSTELYNYGNIILNGYATTGPNTIGKKAWQYKETNTAPVDLPSLTSVTPALKGWTTNYQEYYTQLQPNGYGVNPGDPTMFEYTVHSFTVANSPKWAQPPRRFFQNQVAAFVPPNANQQAIPYSFIYPVADRAVAPPVDTL